MLKNELLERRIGEISKLANFEDERRELARRHFASNAHLELHRAGVKR